MAGILLAANLKTMITMKKTYQKLMMITVLVSFTITNYAADLCVL
jgi:type III secretory pathway component EscU